MLFDIQVTITVNPGDFFLQQWSDIDRWTHKWVES